MEIYIILIIITVIHFILFFFDRFFKSCLFYPYEYLLHKCGVKIGFLNLQWHSTTVGPGPVCLRSRTSDGLIHRFVRFFYLLGALITLTLLPLAVLLLLDSLLAGVTTSTNTGSNNEIAAFEESLGKPLQLEILLPGVTLPFEEIGYYLATLILATIIHELGHALAAIAEDVPVTGFGIYLYFCLPMPYTEISTEHLNSLRWFRRLRVLCAGIWHNLVFAGLCYLILSATGIMISSLYTLNRYVIVTEVAQQFQLRTKDEQRNLHEGDIVTHINECKVLDTESWYRCLVQSLYQKANYCVSSDFIRLNDESVETSHHSPDGHLQCCDHRNRDVCCFEHISDDINNDTPIEIPQHVCLDVRQTVKESFGVCGPHKDHQCSRGFCLKPLLRNSTAILHVRRQKHSPDMDHNDAERILKDFIYYGHPLDMARSVRISPFVPKHSYTASPQWIDAYTLFLKYNVVFNLGLAFINTLPCFGFDGNHITAALIHSFLANRFPNRASRDLISIIVTAFGTLVFALAVIKVLWLNIFGSSYNANFNVAVN